MEPAVFAAVVAGGVAIVTSAFTASITLAVAERKLRRELKLDFAAETVARALLQTEWRLRSFDLIKAHLGGFEDNELRKILVKAGAIRFCSKSGYELWGLLERTSDLLGVFRVVWDPANRPEQWETFKSPGSEVNS